MDSRLLVLLLLLFPSPEKITKEFVMKIDRINITNSVKLLCINRKPFPISNGI